MGWFHRTKEEEQPEAVLDPESIAKEKAPSQNREELKKLQNEIKAQKEHLDSISKKLVDVKREYGEAVGNLMSVKKELIQKKNEINSLKSEQKIFEKKDIEKENSIQKELELKIETNKKELENIRAKQSAAQDTLSKFKAKQKESEYQLHNAQTKLKETQLELENIEVKKQKILDEINGIKKVKTITNEKSYNQKDDPKHVVEAASAVIASMNTKLNIAKKELETIKKLLEKERIEHQKTKKQLDDLKAKSEN